MRQRSTHLPELLFESARNCQDVLVLLHDRDTAHDLSRAIKIGRAAPLIVADLKITNVPQIYRLSVPCAAHNQKLQLVEVVIVDDSTQLVVAVRHFDHPPAGFLKHVLEGGDHLFQRNAGLREQGRKYLQLVLLFQPTNRGHFRNSWDTLKGALDLALVQQAQFPQIVRSLAVNDRILINPAHAAGIRT